MERIDPGRGKPVKRPLETLEATVSKERDPALRRQWRDAIRRGQELVRSDRTLVFSSPANANNTHELKEWLVTCLVRSTEENGQCARELAKLLAISGDLSDNKLALTTLAKYFPHDAEGEALFARLLRSEGDVLWMAEPLRWLSLANPQIYEALLRGERESQVLALRAMGDRLRQASPGVQPAGDYQRLAQGERNSVASPQLVDLAQSVAMAFLNSDVSAEQDVSVTFLTYSNGGHEVLHAAEHTQDAKFRARLVRILATLTERVYLKWSDFRFTPEEADRLMQLLLDADHDVRAAAASAVNFGIPPGTDASTAFQAGSGPTNPNNTAIFRELLDRFPGESDWLALNYFLRVHSIEEEDVVRVADAIRRGMTGTPTFQVQQAFKVLLMRYPAHPATARLLEDHPGLSKGASGASDDLTPKTR